jgi:hypothetical protein
MLTTDTLSPREIARRLSPSLLAKITLARIASRWSVLGARNQPSSTARSFAGTSSFSLTNGMIEKPAHGYVNSGTGH